MTALSQLIPGPTLWLIDEVGIFENKLPGGLFEGLAALEFTRTIPAFGAQLRMVHDRPRDDFSGLRTPLCFKGRFYGGFGWSP